MNTEKVSDEEDNKALRYFARHKRKAVVEDVLGWCLFHILYYFLFKNFSNVINHNKIQINGNV